MLARTARGESGSAQPSASATCAGPEALRAAQQRAEVAGIGHAVQVQPDRARRVSPRTSGGRSFARKTPTARLVCESDESAAITSRRAAQHLRARGEQLVGDAVAAEVVVDERLDRRDAGGQRRAQRVLALVDEEAGAPALLRLAERARGLDAPVGAARDHAGIPLSAATGRPRGVRGDRLGPGLAAGRALQARPRAAGARATASRRSRRRSGGRGTRSRRRRAGARRPSASARSPRSRPARPRAAAARRRCRAAAGSRRRARRPRGWRAAASSRRRRAASRRARARARAAGSRSSRPSRSAR